MSPRPAIPLAFVVALGGAFAPRQFAFSLTGWSGTQGDASQPVPSAATAPPATTSASHAVARESAWRGHLLVAVHGTLALRDRPGGAVTLTLGAAPSSAARARSGWRPAAAAARTDAPLPLGTPVFVRG